MYYYYQEKIRNKSRVEFPPLGMLYCCSIFRELGFDVSVLYFDERTDELPEADYYALSISSTASYAQYRRVAEKLHCENKFIIVGNTQANIFPEQVIKELNANVCFCGESEDAIKKWVWRGMQSEGIIRCERINDISILPLPARDLLPDNLIYMSRRVGGNSNYSVSIMTSRGCIFECAFCAIQNRGLVTFRSLDSIENELIYIKENYPLCDGITIMDETFTLNKNHAIGIIKLLTKYDLPFECNSRIDTLSDEIIKELGTSTCSEVRMGLESGAQKMLDNMKKGISLELAEKSLNY